MLEANSNGEVFTDDASAGFDEGIVSDVANYPLGTAVGGRGMALIGFLNGDF